MSKVLLLIVCIISGLLLRKTNILKKENSTVLNRLIIYFFIPLISLLHIPRLDLSIRLIWLTITPFLVFILGMIYFWLIAKPLEIDEKSKQALILTCGISSTSFVGFPVFELLYGAEGLAYAVILSLGGTILVFNTLGIGLLFKFDSNAITFRQLLIRILKFFPFAIFLFSLLLNHLEIQFGTMVINILEALVSPFAVVALVSIGLQLELRAVKNFKKEIVFGQIYKLIIAPICIFLILYIFDSFEGTIANICILGAGIGSMNAMSIMAAEKNIQPELSILMPAISIPLSVITIFILNSILVSL